MIFNIILILFSYILKCSKNLNFYFQDLASEKKNNKRLTQIRIDLEKEIQDSKQFIQNDELDGLNERLRNYENEISQLQKDCLTIQSISENELEDERTKLCELN